jgi:LysM repeat protein
VVRVADVSPTVALPAQTATTVVAQPTAPAPTQAPTNPSGGPFSYTVQWYDTLYSIARRFNTTVDNIVALNQLPDSNVIQVGQVLKIGGSSQPVTGSSTEYLVQAGDTLYSIARRYGTTVEEIRLANGIVNPWLIHVGDKLSIPRSSAVASSASATTYVVQAGDTLYGIAARFGKQVWDVIVANNLADPHWISVGQILIIPS